MVRIILHIDLDAFFAAVEQRERPELKGKPVIIGADPKQGQGRGVVSTSSYEAREFGVRSAMPISKAWRLCPDGIYLRPNFELYERTSENIMSILRKYADKLEQAGIDEAYLDVSSKTRNFEDALELADKMRKEVLKKENLTCSVGVAPNKLVAKLASDYRKPYGLILVKPEHIRQFLNPLPVRKLIGIGPKTEIKLKNLGIRTIGDLAKFKKGILTKAFGKWGAEMHQLANGIDESEVIEEYEVKSVGREITFGEDITDKELIFKSIDDLVDEFHKEILEGGMQFKTITLKVRYENFETHTRAKSLPNYTNQNQIIKKTAKELASPFLKDSRKIRLVGVRVSNLKFVGKQKTLVEKF